MVCRTSLRRALLCAAVFRCLHATSGRLSVSARLGGPNLLQLQKCTSCCAKESTGQPDARRALWQNFNVQLRTTSQTDLHAAAQAEVKDGYRTPVADLNNMLAKAVQEGASVAYAHVEMEFSVAVWESSPPRVFQTRRGMRLDAGVKAYDACQRLPFYEADRTFWPCREGGSVHSSQPLPDLSSKELLVIFTPAWYDHPVSIINPETPHLSQVFLKYEEAFETCIKDGWRLPFDLHRFAHCMPAWFHTFAGFTGIRGLAVIPAQPLNEVEYPKGGMHSPMGHVVGEHIKLRRDDISQNLFRGVPEDFRELWLVVAAPLRLTLC